MVNMLIIAISLWLCARLASSFGSHFTLDRVILQVSSREARKDGRSEGHALQRAPGDNGKKRAELYGFFFGYTNPCLCLLFFYLFLVPCLSSAPFPLLPPPFNSTLCNHIASSSRTQLDSHTLSLHSHLLKDPRPFIYSLPLLGGGGG